MSEEQKDPRVNFSPRWGFSLRSIGRLYRSGTQRLEKFVAKRKEEKEFRAYAERKLDPDHTVDEETLSTALGILAEIRKNYLSPENVRLMLETPGEAKRLCDLAYGIYAKNKKGKKKLLKARAKKAFVPEKKYLKLAARKAARALLKGYEKKGRTFEEVIDILSNPKEVARLIHEAEEEIIHTRSNPFRNISLGLLSGLLAAVVFAAALKKFEASFPSGDSAAIKEILDAIKKGEEDREKILQEIQKLEERLRAREKGPDSKPEEKTGEEKPSTNKKETSLKNERGAANVLPGQNPLQQFKNGKIIASIAARQPRALCKQPTAWRKDRPRSLIM